MMPLMRRDPRVTEPMEAIKTRPILFAAPMVRAILDGRKTQTRRAVATELRPQNEPVNARLACPWGAPGEQLWVRERWAYANQFRDCRAHNGGPLLYAADEPTPRRGPWHASCHMPRSASRLVLKIVAVRMERLCEISCADAFAE